MRIGLIGGTGGYDWPGLDRRQRRAVSNEHGIVTLTEGRIGEVEVTHLCRHGDGHDRLSNQVDHRANLRALLDAEVDAVIATTVCGAVDASLQLGALVIFDDLYFPSNRLPDGSPCTWHQVPGETGRGHWIFDEPFSEPIRQALIAAGRSSGHPLREAGCYGHVDGPRFNTRVEIAALAGAGVTAISQTLGPEIVLAGEAELPIAALGYITDYANGVGGNPEPTEMLAARLTDATARFAQIVAEALPLLEKPAPTGSVYRFGL